MAEVTGLRNNALPYPVYGAPWGVVFPMLDADGDFVTGATTPDAEVSKNGDTFADCTNESTEIATSSGMYYLLLTATEMTADVVAVIAKSASAGMKTTPIVLHPRKLVTLRTGTVGANAADGTTLQLDSSASAIDDYYNGCLLVAVIDSVTEARIITDYVGSTKVCSVSPAFNTAPDNNDTFTVYLPEGRQVTQGDTVGFGGVAATSSAGRPEVNTTHAAGTAWGSGAITAASIAADAITAAKIADGAIDAATFAAGAINAAAIAVDAIGASELAADAVTEIANAVWDTDATARQTQGTFGQAIGDPGADADSIWALVNTNLNATVGSRATQTSVDTVDDFLDTELPALTAAVQGLMVASGTIGATGNDTTHLHLSGLAYADDAINGMLLTIKDVSTGLFYSRWVEDFANTGDLATVATLPFTPEASVDQYWILPVRADISAGTALQAELDGIQADTEDIQSRLPAALTAGGNIKADALAVSGDATAADTLELFAEALDQATGQIDPGTFTAGAIDANAIAANAIGASELAADAVTEIQSGLATAAALATVDGIVDDILADTADMQPKLGTPAGASISADIAAIEAQTDDIGVAGAGLTAVPWNVAWDAEVQSEVQDAIEANHLDHLLAVTYDPASQPGAADALLNELIENDGGVARYTANALEQGPGGGSAPTAAQIADAVWEEAIADHSGTAGSTAEALNAAGSAGDPWVTSLPGSYTGSQAGKMLSDILVDTGTTLQGELDGIQADTEDIQSRLPAALTAGGNMKADALAVSGDATAADTLELFAEALDQSTGQIDNGTFAAGAIDASAIAADAIGSSELAASAVTEIQSGLATSSALSSLQTDVTTLLGRITSSLFTGITSLAQWLGAMAGKQTANSTARTEIRATGAGSGTYDETTDSQEASRDNVGTNGAALVLAKTTNITGFNDLSAAQVNAEADTALADVGVTTTVTGRIDAAVSTRATPAQVNTEADQALADYDPPTKAELDSAVSPLATAANLSTVSTNVSTLLTRIPAALFSGITSLAQWLGLIAGKQTGDSTARTELRATGAGSGTYDETTDSQEATRDNMGTAQTGDAYGVVSSGTHGNAAIKTILDTKASQTSVDDLPTNSELATALAAADDAVLAAIPTTAQIADKVLGRNIAGSSDGGRTVTSALAAIRNKSAITSINEGAGTATLTVYDTDDVTPLFTVAVSLETLTKSITGMDPAA